VDERNRIRDKLWKNTEVGLKAGRNLDRDPSIRPVWYDGVVALSNDNVIPPLHYGFVE
jgi:hypothetical protein